MISVFFLVKCMNQQKLIKLTKINKINDEKIKIDEKKDRTRIIKFEIISRSLHFSDFLKI